MKKMKIMFLVATMLSVTGSAFAGATEDFGNVQGACVISYNDSVRTRMINVQYIRLIQVEKNSSVVHISMASNYFNGNTDQLKIAYANNIEAIKALQEISYKINDCQYNAAKRRQVKQ